MHSDKAMQGNIHNISTTYTDACDNDTAKLVLLLLYVAPRAHGAQRTILEREVNV